VSDQDTITSLRASLAAEREAREKAEREREQRLAEVRRLLAVQVAGHQATAKDATQNLIRATKAESALAEAKRLLKPFADYMEGGMDRDNKGEPLPDGQGVGWVYLTHGDFRAASPFLAGDDHG
jgi:hypothetical protein